MSKISSREINARSQKEDVIQKVATRIQFQCAGEGLEIRALNRQMDSDRPIHLPVRRLKKSAN